MMQVRAVADCKWYASAGACYAADSTCVFTVCMPVLQSHLEIHSKGCQHNKVYTTYAASLQALHRVPAFVINACT
jgi:hypothetical protein